MHMAIRWNKCDRTSNIRTHFRQGDAMKFDNVLQTIGNTPIIRMNRLFGAGANVWIKSERGNPAAPSKTALPCPWSKPLRNRAR